MKFNIIWSWTHWLAFIQNHNITWSLRAESLIFKQTNGGMSSTHWPYILFLYAPVCCQSKAKAKGHWIHSAVWGHTLNTEESRAPNAHVCNWAIRLIKGSLVNAEKLGWLFRIQNWPPAFPQNVMSQLNESATFPD